MRLIKNLNIAPFVRVVWPNPEILATWLPRIRLAASCYHRLERETVKEGLRRCTTAHVAPDKMNDLGRELAGQGLVFLPYKKVGCYDGFAHSHPPVLEGKPWNYYGPIARNIADAELFACSEDKGDHDTIAQLLGYPDCCARFFRQVWLAGYIDPVWQSAAACGEIQDHTVVIEPSLIFTGLRYIGVRIAPHLPCSFECNKSKSIAAQWIQLARELKVAGINELCNLVTMPLEWDCYKGIAEVTTPYFRVVTNSTPCYPKHIVKVSP